MFEQLEMRRLLSTTTVVQSGTQVTVDASGGTETIVVLENVADGSVHVEVAKAAQPSYDFTGVESVKIVGSGGADDIRFTGHTVDATILAGGGNDFIQIADQGTGSTYADAGGGGDEIVVLNSNETTVIGAGGDDQFFLNTNSTENVNGNDDVVYASGNGGKDFFSAENGTVHILDLAKQDTATGDYVVG